MFKGKINIGITYTGSDAKHLHYVNWIKGNDSIEVIKLSAEDDNLQRTQDVDGIIMSGGIDIHPGRYDSSNTHYPHAPKKFDEERDEFETAVFNLSMQQQLPVLAICRGMQLANCILGGDLIQDIGEDKNKLHRLSGNGKKHDIQIAPGSLLHQITNKEVDIADSAHHQCIRSLGRGLIINARSVDGIVEGIEWADRKNRAFFLGVQWHPERMYLQQIESSSLSKNIRSGFIDAIKKRRLLNHSYGVNI